MTEAATDRAVDVATLKGIDASFVTMKTPITDAYQRAQRMNLDQLHDQVDVFTVIENLPVTVHNAMLDTWRNLVAKSLMEEIV